VGTQNLCFTADSPCGEGRPRGVEAAKGQQESLRAHRQNGKLEQMAPARRRLLVEELRRRHPDQADPEGLIRAGLVQVAGRIVTNPASLVAPGDSITVRPRPDLRGSVKLVAALTRFGIHVAGRVALDIGAAAGGFTAALLDRGAARVYAVDAGHGQLLGSLRQDGRVVNLENTNLGSLTRSAVPDPVDLVTIDVSYLSLAHAVPQLDAVDRASGCDLVALVKPMFELGLSAAPSDRASLDLAVARARDAITAAGWEVLSTMHSPVTGAKGAVEGFVHANWRC
jgi:23S rRNA (cytidine1920-2'-O)/16S rRNA (cytidine1409-2'-O)-methyltransferase